MGWDRDVGLHLYPYHTLIPHLMLLFALIYLLSISAVSDKVIQPLEDQYAQPSVSELKDARAIVVLAGGSYDGVPDFDGKGQNSESSTVRLVAGLRLHRVLHLPVVLSDGRLSDDVATEASLRCSIFPLR